MVGEVNNAIDKVSESIAGMNDKLTGLKTKVIDDNLDKLNFGNTVSGLLGKVDKALNINLFGLGTIASLTGIKIFDINKYKNRPSGFRNIIFQKYGGIEGLHKKYIEETLSGFFTDQPERKATIGSMYAAYEADKANNLSTDVKDVDGILAYVTALGLDAAYLQTITPKIPQVKISYLSKTILDNLEGKKQYLDPNVLASLHLTVPKKAGASGNEVIDAGSKDRDPSKVDKTLIDEYLKSKIAELVTNEGFAKYIASPDHFVLSLMGGLFVNGNTFAEAVLLGIRKPEDFALTVAGASTVTPETTTVSAYTGEVKTPTDFVNYTKWTILSHESSGNYGAVNKNDVGSVSLGLLQRHQERAQKLLKHLKTTNPTKFASIMGNEFKDLNVASLWNKPWDDDKANKFSLLMKETVFQKAMDDYVNTDVRSYIDKAHDMGLTDPKVVVLYCNMLNAGAGWAETQLSKVPVANRNDIQKVYEAVMKTDFLAKYPGVKKAYEKLYTQQLASITLPQLDFSQMA